MWTRLVLACIMLALTVAGCKEEKKEEKPPETTPPPVSVDQMVSEALQSLQLLEIIPPGTPLQFLVSPEGHAQLLKYLGDWKTKSEAEPNGKAAIEKVMQDLDTRMRTAREAQNAAVVLLTTDLLDVLGSDKGIIDRYREWAKLHNNRPVVRVLGFYMEKDDSVTPPKEITYAQLEVRIPETGETKREQIREGSEFDGLRFEEVIGKRRGVGLRYLATGDTFQVMR